MLSQRSAASSFSQASRTSHASSSAGPPTPPTARNSPTRCPASQSRSSSQNASSSAVRPACLDCSISKTSYLISGRTDMRGVESTTVLHELDEHGVVTLTLNRPGRNNAWTRELEGALHDLLEQASTSPDVRAIVITGAGRSFCPGLDSEELDRVSQDGQAMDQSGRRRLTLPTYVPKPVVCAVNGACAGLGLILALMSDVRFAAHDAKITTAFVRRGLPAEEASAWMLNRIVGHARSIDLLMSGRVILGDEAASIGLVHASYEREALVGRALDYARDLADNCSPRAMAAVK